MSCTLNGFNTAELPFVSPSRACATKVRTELDIAARRFKLERQNEGLGPSLTLCLHGNVSSFADNGRSAGR